MGTERIDWSICYHELCGHIIHQPAKMSTLDKDMLLLFLKDHISTEMHNKLRQELPGIYERWMNS